MAKLAKAQRNELQRIEAHLARALAYIAKPSTVVAFRKGQATTTVDYSRADGAALCEVAKEYGSDLTGLSEGLSRLRLFLADQA